MVWGQDFSQSSVIVLGISFEYFEFIEIIRPRLTRIRFSLFLFRLLVSRNSAFVLHLCNSTIKVFNSSKLSNIIIKLSTNRKLFKKTNVFTSALLNINRDVLSFRFPDYTNSHTKVFLITFKKWNPLFFESF